MLACCCCGCTLISQRTFNRQAGRTPTPPAAAAAVRGPAPPPALFVVHEGIPDADWRSGLRVSVQDALARKPNVLFTVQSVVPADASPAAQAAAMRATALDLASPVAQAIVADGAAASQVELAAAADRGVREPEVRITVR